MATCKSCGAKITWAKTEGGKPIPLNSTRVRAYHLTNAGTKDDIAIPLRQHETSEVLLFYVSHFVSCPDASSHSKGGK